jgi:hypothetical protein
VASKAKSRRSSTWKLIKGTFGLSDFSLLFCLSPFWQECQNRLPYPVHMAVLRSNQSDSSCLLIGGIAQKSDYQISKTFRFLKMPVSRRLPS